MQRRRVNPKSDRIRKISIQNDYAFCIISPLASSTLPTTHLEPPTTSSQSTSMNSLQHPQDVIEPRATSDNEEFRRWSFSHYQHIYHPNFPSGVNVAPEFLSDNARLTSRSSLGVLSRESERNTASGFFSGILNIPERIRKLSAEKNKFNAQTVTEETRDQMRKIEVY